MNRNKIILLALFPIFLQNTFAQDIFGQDSIISKTLSQQWELLPKDKKGTFKLTSYKPIYITAGRWSSRPNRQPQSENPDYSVDAPKDFNNYEAKFQLSFKTKILESFFFGKGDLWAGFTQIAHWQLYNTDLSRPFRELNYEPELMLNFPLDFKFLGFRARMFGMGINHQSNGRDVPRSRSWNRLMFHFAMERENLQIYLKPWIRMKSGEDQNPMITDYVGQAEATVIFNIDRHNFYIIGTNSLSLKDNKGSVQFNYLYPLKANLRAHLQLFSGYGETLIDYNHRQTTIGLGISFIDW
ncbi:MAG: phospholipase A [Sediminicola sp.]